MKIGIIIYSNTGHTNYVAGKLEEKLLMAGNEVEIQHLRVEGGQQVSNKNSKIKNPPILDKYDALIFGAPVHSFSLSKVMDIYLNQIQSLKDKKVICFVTKGLPFNWTGGNQAISKMQKTVSSKEGIVFGTEIIIWNQNRDHKIDEMVQKFTKMF